jgi:hypothetical protein
MRSIASLAVAAVAVVFRVAVPWELGRVAWIHVLHGKPVELRAPVVDRRVRAPVVQHLVDSAVAGCHSTMRERGWVEGTDLSLLEVADA